MFFDLGIIDGCSIFLCVISYQFREGFKKNLEFSRFGLNHPHTLVIAENLGKKNKIF